LTSPHLRIEFMINRLDRTQVTRPLFP
jgi:hypothetical protein